MCGSIFFLLVAEIVQDATNELNGLKIMNSTGIFECAEHPQTSQSHTEIKPNVTSNIAQLGFAEQPQSNAGIFSYSIA